jgi:hypothetical protein
MNDNDSRVDAFSMGVLLNHLGNWTKTAKRDDSAVKVRFPSTNPARVPVWRENLQRGDLG